MEKLKKKKKKNKHGLRANEVPVYHHLKDDEFVVTPETLEALAKIPREGWGAVPPKFKESVNHPAHYNGDPSGVECIDVVRHRNFNIGNSIKYLWRAGLKDSDAEIQDLKKALWYIEDEIKRLEENK